MKRRAEIKLDDNLEPYPLRIPSYLKEFFEKMAKAQKRSLNSEIILIMESEYNAINHKN